MFEYLPEVIEAALSNLYVEALLKVSVDKGRKTARSTVELLAKHEYEAKLGRLELHEGPRPRFRHRTQYENALKQAISELLSKGEPITQSSVAGTLGKDDPKSIDEGVVRRWNREFGVNWKVFVKEAIKADKS